MKAWLMHRDRDFELQAPGPANEAELRQDLELDTMLLAMAGDDELAFNVAKAALLHPLVYPEEIRYRQDAFEDCVTNASTVRELYALALETLRIDRGVWGLLGRTPDSILHAARRSLDLLIGKVLELRELADAHAEQFNSDAFRQLFEMVQAELSDEYFAEVKEQLAIVEFKHGMLMSARLGRGNKGTDYMLRLTPKLGWRERLGRLRHPAHGFTLDPRDEAGFQALSDLRGVALNNSANALAQSTEHIKSFFNVLATELAFYIGCLNLWDRLQETGASVCRPEATDGEPRLHAQELHDVSLTLRLGKPAVGNDVQADGCGLIVVTGANQGGKSTFLRSVGIAQLMTQSGMFVGADAFSANVRDHVFTHYKREEDESMERGKFDEELDRMSVIADEITPQSLFLSNESFASTNEREGSEVARQVVHALRDADIKVVFVTHLFDFAGGIHEEERDDVLFLRAPRSEGGERTYKLVEGEPLPTSYGEDTYRTIFGAN